MSNFLYFILVEQWLISWSTIIVVVVAGAIWFQFNRKVAGIFLAAGLATIIYIMGRKNGRDSYEKIAKDIQDKREDAYEKIDNRNTSASDATDRLRNGDY